MNEAERAEVVEAIPLERSMVTVRPEETAVVLWGTDDPRAMVTRMTAVADALKAAIEDRGMVNTISGRKYVRAEGWAMVGAMLGIFARTVSVEVDEVGQMDELTIERRGQPVTLPAFTGNITYKAHVDLVTRDGGVVGGATALCSRREERWRERDDSQIASMAQTRAAAKAARMTLGFIMPIAGYEATPAEEMDGVEPAARTATPPRAKSEGQAHPRGAPKPPDKLDTVGDLFTWTRYQHDWTPNDVAKFLGVENSGDVAKTMQSKRLTVQDVAEAIDIELMQPPAGIPEAASPEAQEDAQDAADSDGESEAAAQAEDATDGM